MGPALAVDGRACAARLPAPFSGDQGDGEVRGGSGCEVGRAVGGSTVGEGPGPVGLETGTDWTGVAGIVGLAGGAPRGPPNSSRASIAPASASVSSRAGMRRADLRAGTDAA